MRLPPLIRGGGPPQAVEGFVQALLRAAGLYMKTTGNR